MAAQYRKHMSSRSQRNKASRRSSMDANTRSYISDVAKRFRTTPEVYRQFLHILSDVRNPSVPRLHIVTRIGELFSDQPDLMNRLNSFLPEQLKFELQKDAVVLKRSMTLPSNMERHQDDIPQKPKKANRASLEYVHLVKSSISANEYQTFLRIMKDFHEQLSDLMTTIERIISLFKANVPLVVGFNNYLPDGYRIDAAGHFSYDIICPKQLDEKKSNEDVRFMYDSSFL